MMNQPDISVVIPVYNSAAILNELVERIAIVLTNTNYEIVLIDDGSKDNSWAIISQLKETHHKTIKGIQLNKNYGQHNALLCGMINSKGKNIITMDDDLQHPPEEIEKLIAKQKETNAQVVYGIPHNKKHDKIRKAGSYFVRKSSKYFANNPSGEGSSFRLIDAEIISQIKLHHANNYIFIDEIIHWYTSDIALVDVTHHERKAGKSGYTLARLIRLYLSVFINYTANPLKLMIYGGLTSSILFFLIGLRFVFKKITIGAPLGYTSLIVSILFSTSLVMLCLGVIGKYIFNLHQQQSGKPLYGIRKII
jgi:glycosyltransferase involved in cell wall biosynthesis